MLGGPALGAARPLENHRFRANQADASPRTGFFEAVPKWNRHIADLPIFLLLSSTKGNRAQALPRQ